MTLKDLMDQVEVTGRIVIMEKSTSCYHGNAYHLVEYAKDYENLLNNEVVYIFPAYVDNKNGICIWIK